jgi:hypothetical protein
VPVASASENAAYFEIKIVYKITCNIVSNFFGLPTSLRGMGLIVQGAAS